MKTTTRADIIVMVIYFVYSMLCIAGLKGGLWLTLSGLHLWGVLVTAVFGWMLIEGGFFVLGVLKKGREYREAGL